MASEHPQAPEGSPSPSRYARLKAILDEAASSSTASYQGDERFWHLPLAAFLELTLYGVRMIALAAPGAAAGADVGHSAALQPSPGRGATSGLIKGLKGNSRSMAASSRHCSGVASGW